MDGLSKNCLCLPLSPSSQRLLGSTVLDACVCAALRDETRAPTTADAATVPSDAAIARRRTTVIVVNMGDLSGYGASEGNPHDYPYHHSARFLRKTGHSSCGGVARSVPGAT